MGCWVDLRTITPHLAPLRQLLLLCVFSLYCSSSIHARYLYDLNCDNLRAGIPEIDRPSRISLVFQLQNECSGMFVRMEDNNKVNAQAAPDDADSYLEAESAKHCSIIEIRGNRTKMPLCFNKRGRLIIRHGIPKDRTLCQFQERIENRYMAYISVYNPDWKVAFRSNGKPLHGASWTREKYRQCSRFNKLLQPSDQEPYTPLPGTIFKEFWKNIMNNYRHSNKTRSMRGR